MKKGVNLGRVIRNVIIFILAIFMIFGALFLCYEIVKKNFKETETESFESATPASSTTVSAPDLSEESLSDELDMITDVSAESNFQEQPEELNSEAPTNQTEVVDENATEQTDLASSIADEQNEYVGTICLTFDDGPSVEITNQILDILQEKNVKATFFILDYDEEKLSIINREIENGHTVALHGYSHDYSNIYSNLESLESSFVTLQEKLYADTGYYSTFIRFPGGSSNTVSKKYCTGIMTEATQAFTNLGFVYFDWNVDSQDAGGAKSAEEIYNNVTSTLVDGRTNVVLMHDAQNKTYTVEALRRIIDYGIEHGFEFKAISQDTKVVQHNVNN